MASTWGENIKLSIFGGSHTEAIGVVLDNLPPNEKIDMEKLINDEVSKFKWKRKDVEFIVEYDHKSVYFGTVEHWETILDNLLNNFMRYASTTIKINAKQNKIILYIHTKNKGISK